MCPRRWTARLSLAITLSLLAAPGLVFANSWGGDGCAASDELRALVDDALAASPAAAAFPNRGSGAPGYSAAVFHDDCGLFAHAVGRRRIEGDRPMLASTRHHLGSLTKPVTSALTLILADRGAFGPDGIDSPIDGFLTSAERRLLKKGRGPGGSLCPARISGFDRLAEQFRPVRAKCPRFSRITVRHLLNGNHGLWDFINEVDRDRNGIIDVFDYLLGDLFDALGVAGQRLERPVESAFALLATTGVLANKAAVIGDTRPQDFEISFGNTGYQLLGVLLERVSGESYDALVKQHVVKPLGLTRMSLALHAPTNRNGKLATPYSITSGAKDADLPSPAATDEQLLGTYPLADVNGHPAIDTFDLEPFLLTNGGGGAGALSAAPKAYVRFFHALVRGGLLSDRAQALLDAGFVPVNGTGFEHGFALFSAPAAGFGRLINKGGATIGSNCIALHALARSGGSGATAVVCRNSADLFLPNPTAGLPNTALGVDDLALDLLAAAIP